MEGAQYICALIQYHIWWLNPQAMHPNKQQVNRGHENLILLCNIRDILLCSLQQKVDLEAKWGSCFITVCPHMQRAERWHTHQAWIVHISPLALSAKHMCECHSPNGNWNTGRDLAACSWKERQRCRFVPLSTDSIPESHYAITERWHTSPVAQWMFFLCLGSFIFDF